MNGTPDPVVDAGGDLVAEPHPSPDVIADALWRIGDLIGFHFAMSCIRNPVILDKIEEGMAAA